MTLKMKTPDALAGATGADIETASFLNGQYPVRDRAATPFTHISTAALRVVHLASRHGLTVERAAMVAPLIFGEGRA